MELNNQHTDHSNVEFAPDEQWGDQDFEDDQPQWEMYPEEGGQIITHNIFVGDLNPEVTEEDLRDAFIVCGAIHSVNIMRDKHSGAPVGYGFVHFKTKDAQQAALKPPFCNQNILGHPCRVNPSDDKNTLFVGNLPVDLNEEEIKTEIEAFVGQTSKIELKTGPPPDLESRGFAFVTFVDKQSTETAKRILSTKSINGFQLNVKWAEARKEVTAETMANVTTLYVANLHKFVSMEMLSGYYSQWGNVTNTVIVKDNHSGISKGFGFVTFEHRADCEQALNYSNNQHLCGQALSVTLAKPVPESIRKGARGNASTKGGRGGAGRTGGRFEPKSAPSYQQPTASTRGGNARGGYFPPQQRGGAVGGAGGPGGYTQLSAQTAAYNQQAALYNQALAQAYGPQYAQYAASLAQMQTGQWGYGAYPGYGQMYAQGYPQAAAQTPSAYAAYQQTPEAYQAAYSATDPATVAAYQQAWQQQQTWQ